MDPSPFPLPRCSLRGAEGLPVVGPALGVTFYLADPFFWADEGLPRALELFFAGPWRGELRWVTTSLLDHWRPLSPGGFQDVIAAAAREKKLVHGPRHHFTLSVADDPHVPETGLRYTEIDPRASERTAVLELTLPVSAPPALLHELALRMAAIGPFFCGVGGYVARFNASFRRLAFNQFFMWARRYLGVDVQLPDEAAWYASSSLPGSGWLNFLGAPWADRREQDLGAWLTRRWAQPGVVSTAVKPGDPRGGVLVRAGELPTLADRNQLVWPAAYAEVARALAEFFPEEMPPFWGPFYKRELTRPWLLRLIAPEGWT